MFIMDASSELNLKNKAYFKAVNHFVWGNYKQDLPRIDITTKNFLGKYSKEIIATISSNQNGIIAGVQESLWFLKKLKIKQLKHKKDGEEIKKGEVLLKIKGKASSILASERTLLNLLQRMSGIATKTKKLSNILPKRIKLLATRKTLWGQLDKRAVTLGRGGTHRLDLSDAILIKDNHINLNQDFKKSLENCLKIKEKTRFIEIELETENQVKEFLEIYDELNKKSNLKTKKIIVMLDNFKPNVLKKLIHLLKRRNLIIEVSGGINEKNILSYTIKGVDAISSGAITMAAPHLDLSLTIESKKS